MSLVEIVLIVVCVLFVLALGARICVGVLKFIYDNAPIVVPLVILGSFLYFSGHGFGFEEIERKVKDANHIRSVEN